MDCWQLSSARYLQVSGSKKSSPFITILDVFQAVLEMKEAVCFRSEVNGISSMEEHKRLIRMLNGKMEKKATLTHQNEDFVLLA